MSNFLDTDSSILENNLKFVKNEVEDELDQIFGQKTEQSAPPREYKVVTPKPGQYLLLHTVSESPSKTTLTLLDGKFFQLDPGSSDGKSIVVTCVKCSPKIVKIKGCASSSSNFLSHLKRKHGNEAVAEYHQYVKQVRQKRKRCRTEAGFRNSVESEDLSNLNSSTNIITQTNFEQDLTNFFIHSMIPLNVVEDPFFCRMLNNLGVTANHSINLLNQKALSDNINKFYMDNVTQMKSTLQAAEHLCTVVDIWESRERSFLGLTALWIDADFNRRSKALACRGFSGIHSHESFSMLLDNIHTEFDLNQEKIVATLIYDESSFMKAFREFGVSMNTVDNLTDSGEHDFDTEEIADRQERLYSTPWHFQCAAHTLNLCALVDGNRILKDNNHSPLYEIHNKTIEKCNILWNATDCPESAETIQKILGHPLSKPDVTKWISLYDAMRQIYSIKDKTVQLHKALYLENAITACEFEYIQEYIVCLGPIADALNILQGDKNMFYGLLVPCLMALQKKLRELQYTPFRYCSELARSYAESIEKRFDKFFKLFTPIGEHAVIATLSYPRFKNKWFPCITPQDQERITTIFKNVVAKEISKRNYEDDEHENEAEPENAFFNFDSNSRNEANILQKQSPTTRAHTMISQFFVEEDRSLKVLDRYDEIKTVFKRYNTPLPSLASVQRLHISDIMTNLPKSNSLSDHMFEQRAVLKINLLE